MSAFASEKHLSDADAFMAGEADGGDQGDEAGGGDDDDDAEAPAAEEEAEGFSFAPERGNVAFASAADGWSVTLEVSRNSGAAWSTACFPSFEAEHGYTLYDMGGEVFVHVDTPTRANPSKPASRCCSCMRRQSGMQRFTPMQILSTCIASRQKKV
jgi:formylglycine-generating enzyme required for sulfatase activity